MLPLATTTTEFPSSGPNERNRRRAFSQTWRKPAGVAPWAGPAVAALLLSACTQTPEIDGPRARMIPGIEAPRDTFILTLHETDGPAVGKCYEMLAKMSPGKAALYAATLSLPIACARVPRDFELAEGKTPWCIVAVPKGDSERLLHELRHCRGFASPAGENRHED